MGLFGFGGKSNSEYNALVEKERMKAKNSFLKEQAKARGKQLAKKDAESARFASLSRSERAGERLKKGRGYLKKVGSAVGTIGNKLNEAGERFDQKAAKYNNQNQTFGNVPEYLKSKK